MLRVCKGNAPVSVKKECVFDEAIKREYGCVYASPPFPVSTRQLLVCVCVYMYVNTTE